MIKKLRIRNFRGIKEGEIELAPLTVLLGGNNSGKTTILEALFLAPNTFREVPYAIGEVYTDSNIPEREHSQNHGFNGFKKMSHSIQFMRESKVA